MLFFLDFWGMFALRAVAVAVAVAVTTSLPAKVKQITQRTLPLLLLLLLLRRLLRLTVFPQQTLFTDWLDTVHRR